MKGRLRVLVLGMTDERHLAMVRAFAEQGAALALEGREQLVDALAAELRARGAIAVALRRDRTRANVALALTEAALMNLGAVDVVVSPRDPFDVDGLIAAVTADLG
jgi:NAD(P)-dependent dehydrogenase (short-subunit alcohol dehydrogenase family)